MFVLSNNKSLFCFFLGCLSQSVSLSTCPLACRLVPPSVYQPVHLSECSSSVCLFCYFCSRRATKWEDNGLNKRERKQNENENEQNEWAKIKREQSAKQKGKTKTTKQKIEGPAQNNPHKDDLKRHSSVVAVVWVIALCSEMGVVLVVVWLFLLFSLAVSHIPLSCCLLVQEMLKTQGVLPWGMRCAHAFSIVLELLSPKSRLHLHFLNVRY